MASGKCFKCVMAIILCLDEHTLASRASLDTLYMARNGRFLGLMEFIARFNLTLKHDMSIT